MRIADQKNYISLIIKISVLVLTIISTVWLIHQFCRLFFESSFIWQSSVKGGIDLLSRYKEFHYWIDGDLVYGKIKTSVYPPASYVMLAPLLIWSDIQIIKVILSIGYIISLFFLIKIIITKSGCTGKFNMVFAGLIPLAMYPAGASIGNGQITLLIFPFLLYGILLVKDEKSSLSKDLLFSFLILVSLIKPNISAPFLWIALIFASRLRPVILVIGGYLLLTMISIYFQDQPTDIIIKNYISSVQGMLFSTEYKSYDPANILMKYIVENRFLIPVSIILFFILGWWIYTSKRTDIWLLLGVTAILTRYLSYHRWYDDILILIPIITLLRYLNNENSGRLTKYFSFTLLSLTLLFTMAPGGFYLFSEPYKSIYMILQNVIFLTTLIFFIILTRIETNNVHLNNAKHV